MARKYRPTPDRVEFPETAKSYRSVEIIKDGSTLFEKQEFNPLDDVKGMKAQEFSLDVLLKNGATDLLKPYATLKSSNLHVADVVNQL